MRPTAWLCPCVQRVPGAGAAPTHRPGPGDREADGAAEGVAVEGAAEVPTAAPHAGEGQAADAPARSKNAAPQNQGSSAVMLNIWLKSKVRLPEVWTSVVIQ